MTRVYKIYGTPITKKNSQRIVTLHGHACIIPSKQYKEYEAEALRTLKPPVEPIAHRVNMKCEYYMPTKRRVDLANLISASCDILVKAKVILDDNSNIVVGHDGSRVYYDKENPRAEITITNMEE